MELTGAQARYLLALYRLGTNGHEVRCAELARTLHVTRPSVAKMLSLFSERQLIAQKRYGKVYLTDTGYLLARQYAKRLEASERLLAQEFQLTQEEAQQAACALLDALPGRCFEEIYEDGSEI